jgi:hypothetical protein
MTQPLNPEEFRQLDALLERYLVALEAEQES